MADVAINANGKRPGEESEEVREKNAEERSLPLRAAPRRGWESLTCPPRLCG
jgi:hypothetical protein